MSNLKLVPFFFIAVFIVLFSGMIILVSDEIITNDNLDNESVQYITSLNSQLAAKYDVSQLGEGQSNLSTNASFEGVDPFTLQYLESKSESQQKISTLDVLKATPDTFLLSFELEEESVEFFYDLARNVITFILGIIGFVLLFGSGRADD